MEHSEAATKYAELIAARALATADALLAELNRDPSALLFGRPVADLTEQLFKVALSMENLSLINRTEGGVMLYKSLDERYVDLLVVLGRVHSSFQALSQGRAG